MDLNMLARREISVADITRYASNFKSDLEICTTPRQLTEGFLYFSDCVNIYFSFGLHRCWICPVWNPRRLFNGRLALTHHRNQAQHVFYDLVNEQLCCETCVCVLGGG